MAKERKKRSGREQPAGDTKKGAPSSSTGPRAPRAAQPASGTSKGAAKPLPNKRPGARRAPALTPQQAPTGGAQPTPRRAAKAKTDPGVRVAPVAPPATKPAPASKSSSAPATKPRAQASSGTTRASARPAARRSDAPPSRVTEVPTDRSTYAPMSIAPTAISTPPKDPPSLHAPAAPRPAAVISVPIVDEAAFKPPGITIDADDIETMAVDAPQFARLGDDDDSADVDAPAADSIDFDSNDARASESPSGAPEYDVYSNDYYMRQWGRAGLRGRSEQVDEFGLDPTYDARFRRAFELVFRKYFRTSVSGLEHVPATGRALLVSNHSGTFPWDGVMLKTAIRLDHPTRRDLRWLTEDFVYHFPFLGTFLNRIGAVRANPENAERLLARDQLVAVFPEGIQGIGKLYRQRYQLQRFGRGGYIKLALRSGAPIIPTAIVGAEETNPLLFKIGWLTKLTGLPYLPVTPTFPWLGALGLVPLPTKWRVVFGAPIDLSEHGPEGADDAILVNRLNERVRATIQTMVDDALAARDSVLFG